MEFRIDRFLGLAQAQSDELMNPGQTRDAVNVSTDDGGLSRARGYAAVAPALAGGIGSLAAFYPRVNGALCPRLLAVNEAGVYEHGTSGWQTLYAGLGGASASALNYQQNGVDILLLADGVRPVLRYDGQNAMAALEGCPAVFSELALHYERVWGSGIATEPDAVYWSRAFDPTNWTGDTALPEAGGGVVLLPTFNGGRTRALRAIFGDVLVFKDEDLYRVVGTYPGNYEIVRVHGVVGPVAPRSIVQTATACFFLGRDGLCAYDGVSVSTLGDRSAQAVYGRVNPAHRAKACAALAGDTLYLALPLDDATENNALLEWHISDGRCLLRTGVAARCFLTYGDALLFGAPDGCVYRLNDGDTRAGASIDARWTTPWFDLNRPGAAKWIEGLDFFGRGAFRITVETDRGRRARRFALGDAGRGVRAPFDLAGTRFRLIVENQNGADFAIAPGVRVRLSTET